MSSDDSDNSNLSVPSTVRAPVGLNHQLQFDSDNSDSSVTSTIVAPVGLQNQQHFASSISSHASSSGNDNSMDSFQHATSNDSPIETDFSDNTVGSSVIYTNGEDSLSPLMADSPIVQDNDSDATWLDDEHTIDSPLVTVDDDNADSGEYSQLRMSDDDQSNESVAGDSTTDRSITSHLSDESSGQDIFLQQPEIPDDQLSDSVPSPEQIEPPVVPAVIESISPQPLNEPSNEADPVLPGNSEVQADPVLPGNSEVQAGNIIQPTESAAQVAPSTSRQTDQERSTTSRDGNSPPNKRQRLNSEGSPPPKKVATTLILDDDDDGTTCTICLDQWTSSGEHRIVSLKCGHLFGFSCIERWIKNQKPAERKCPTCKAKAKMTDLRNLYGHKIQMVDTCELEELRVKNKQLEREKECLTREVDFMRKQNEDLLVKQREDQMQIQQLKTERLVSQCPQKAAAQSHSSYRAQLIHTLELSKTEGCRVSAFNRLRNIIVASIPSPTMLFQGFSLKMIDAASFRTIQTMPSHNKMIRDVAFSNDGKFLLSCGMDKVATVLCMDWSTVVANFTTETALWSVCWDADDPWVLFTGGQNGVVQQFDIRNPSQELSRLTTLGDMTPVNSIVSIPKTSKTGWMQGGLISCRFRQLCPYKRLSSNTFEAEPCSIEGTFTSMRYDRSTEHLLVSTRPTQRAPRAQHMTYQMSTDGHAPQYNLVQTFLGSTTQGVMSKSCLMPIKNQQDEVDDMLVCSYVESENQVALWSVSTGQKLQGIQSPETVTDLCPINVNGKTYLTALGDRRLRVYRVDKT